MNVLFLTMSRIPDCSFRGVYMDLMNKFREEGHCIYIVTPRERSLGQSTGLTEKENIHILGVRTLNLQKTSVIEKGVGQVMVESQYKTAIKHYFSGIRFDLILYSTPPITFHKVIKYLKKQNPEAKTYLLLKDIFPQNAVDLGMMKKKGLKGVLYRYFRNKEKALYAISDNIGCMSPANVEYLLKHNPEINRDRVEIAPNSIELTESGLGLIDKREVRLKYGLPIDKPIFIYGGNLGKPQAIPFLIDCLKDNGSRNDCHFVIVGNGTEYGKLHEWIQGNPASCVTLMARLPKNEYDELVQSCDVGLIFLDHRFTIPNYPSRLLNYLEYKIPVLCSTDPNTDIGRIAEENGYGFWCESNTVDAFTGLVNRFLSVDRKAMGERGYEYLCGNYLVDNTYQIICSHQ